MYKKIIVTGGTGLVGSALKDISNTYPDRDFIFIGSKDCDLTKLDNVLDFVGKHKPDAIIHLAAVACGVGLGLKKPATLLRDNVFINMNILEAARILNIEKTVMSLSTGMYPTDAPNPIKEDYIHQGYPHDSNYGYSFAKRLIDPCIRAYRAEFDMKVIGLVPNGIFGEHGNFTLDGSHMVAALIRRFYENKGNSEKIVIWGDGSPLREFTYGQDMARAYMWCLDNYDNEQILHVGSTEEHSVKDIALMIADIMGVDKSRIEFDTSKPAGIYKKSTDNSRFMSVSDFKYTPFKDGLRNTIHWFMENYNVPGAVRL